MPTTKLTKVTSFPTEHTVKPCNDLVLCNLLADCSTLEKRSPNCICSKNSQPFPDPPISLILNPKQSRKRKSIIRFFK